jgi:hypothetical protein
LVAFFRLWHLWHFPGTGYPLRVTRDPLPDRHIRELPE